MAYVFRSTHGPLPTSVFLSSRTLEQKQQIGTKSSTDPPWYYSPVMFEVISTQRGFFCRIDTTSHVVVWTAGAQGTCSEYPLTHWTGDNLDRARTGGELAMFAWTLSKGDNNLWRCLMAWGVIFLVLQRWGLLRRGWCWPTRRRRGLVLPSSSPHTS
jgi:hypothetical protein